MKSCSLRRSAGRVGVAGLSLMALVAVGAAAPASATNSTDVGTVASQPAIAEQGSGTAEADIPADVLKAIEQYLAAQDAVRVDPVVAERAGSGTRALSAVAGADDSAAGDAAAYAEAGLDIVESVTPNTELSPSVVGEDGSVRVHADITTTVQSVEQGTSNVPEESSWTDEHIYKATPQPGGSYVVTNDVIVPPPSDGSVEGDVTPPEDVTDPLPEDESVLERDPEEEAAGSIELFQSSTSGSATAAYAKKWTKANKLNTAYPDLPNDCANFASQSLRAGGWDLKGGTNPRDTNNWHYNLTGPAGPSWTWSNSKTLYYYAKVRANWTKYNSVYSAKQGDLIFADWDPKGKADGTLDHTMVVTGMKKTGSKNMPYISQKSSNRYNIPFSQSLKLAKDQGKTSMKFYALKHR
ncbi:amidase domain-containing protein [Isoptericola sp. NEAU-Y5]|uniref:Amidase domain-containing protein n=1 Tax=Isoptericola luteus TaxID=2879484 RepID=A0ABS7ZJF1_9MICO|nr:amidase domain-containing protein [Isoptericola sp. NEAU-Y5]MCA5895150.1 amidase domain-containing protein [Isoptericola sp. NEAU-Y5]